ncbi:MAG: flagellar protein FlaG [Spirochaetaceae bacterium]|jgi:flagellar protein FlaG|nr:flagellar protein FlaG [Spirochaetaceae bacterium]
MNLTVNVIGQRYAVMDNRKGRNTSDAVMMQQTPSAAVQDPPVTLPGAGDVIESVKQLQNISDLMGRKVRFGVNEELGKVIVKIIDSNTDKVIKEIPSTEIQQLQAHIKEVLGLLIDEKR